MNTYFIQRGADGPIKIGVSADPQRRIAHLQTACAEPLRVLAIWQHDPEFDELTGFGTAERWMHAELAPYRVGGEWFEACAWVQSFLEPLGIDIGVPADEVPLVW